MLIAKLFLNYYYIYKLFPFRTYIFTFLYLFSIFEIRHQLMPHANKTKIQTVSICILFYVSLGY